MLARVFPTAKDKPEQSSDVVPPWAPRWLRPAMLALAALYLAAVWLDAVGTDLPTHLLPPPARLFVQVAKLFPQAAQNVIEWRILGYRCATGKFAELDVRPFFPIHADDKENRFDRAMFFYFKNPRVLTALDEYVVNKEAQLGPDQRIGGVMLLSLRIPIPPLGTPGERFQRRPFTAYPHSWGHYWYKTPRSDLDRRCTEAP